MTNMKNPLNLFFLGLVFTLTSFAGTAQGDIIGKWQTVDDNTGEVKSVVEIYEENGKLYGAIRELFRGSDEDPDPMCVSCKGDKKDQRITGLVIVEDMTKDGSEYSGGTITDPENGKEYKCKMWLENGDLKVRGYWGFLYRTQTWHK